MQKHKGVVICRSRYAVKETVDRLCGVLQQRGATVYSSIDQQAEGAKAGISMPPFEIILFGNPKAGVPAMKENPIAALDLPLKVVVWEDEKQRVWLAYNKKSTLQKRYALPKPLTTALNIEPLLEAASVCYENNKQKQKAKA